MNAVTTNNAVKESVSLLTNANVVFKLAYMEDYNSEDGYDEYYHTYCVNAYCGDAVQYAVPTWSSPTNNYIFTIFSSGFTTSSFEPTGGYYYTAFGEIYFNLLESLDTDPIVNSMSTSYDLYDECIKTRMTELKNLEYYIGKNTNGVWEMVKITLDNVQRKVTENDQSSQISGSSASVLTADSNTYYSGIYTLNADGTYTRILPLKYSSDSSNKNTTQIIGFDKDGTNAMLATESIFGFFIRFA